MLPERHELFSQATSGSLLRGMMLEPLLGTVIESVLVTVLVPLRGTLESILSEPLCLPSEGLK